MHAGRARPRRAADMKKDVRILLVGERESAHRRWRRPPRPLPGAPAAPGLPFPFAPLSSIRAPSAPSPLTLQAAVSLLPHLGPPNASLSCPPVGLPGRVLLSLCPPGIILSKVLSLFPSSNPFLLGLSVCEAASFQTLSPSVEIPLSLHRQVPDRAQ